MEKFETRYNRLLSWAKHNCKGYEAFFSEGDLVNQAFAELGESATESEIHKKIINIFHIERSSLSSNNNSEHIESAHGTSTVCTRCHKELPMSEFPIVQYHTRGGFKELSQTCRECRNKISFISAKKAVKNGVIYKNKKDYPKETRSKYNKSFHDKNKNDPEYMEKRRMAKREWYKKNKDKTKNNLLTL